MPDEIDQLLKMYAPDHDWTDWNEDVDPTPEELFRKCVKTASVDFYDSVEHYPCGSSRPHDAAKALYRALFLCRPSSVDFSGFYKSGSLFVLHSECSRFSVSVETYKYELALYYACDRESLTGAFRGVQSGVPGADNGTKCKDPAGVKFFQMVEASLNREWLIYSGNNFEV